MENKQQQNTASFGSSGNSGSVPTSANVASVGASTNNTSAPTTLPPAPEHKHPRLRRLLVRVGLPVLGLLIIIGIVFALSVLQRAPEDSGRVAENFNNVEFPLDEIIDEGGVDFDGSRSLVINGTLKANEGVVVTPSTLPTAPTEGQIYYDQDRDEVGYYNGSQFIYLGEEEAGVTSFSGATGAITIGAGLAFSDGTLSATPFTEAPDGDAVTGNEITNIITSAGLVRVGAGTTVDPFRVGLITCTNGQTIKSSGAGAWDCAADNGATYTAGTGISFNGTQINNSGVISFAIPAGSGLVNAGSAQNVSLKLQDCADNQILQYDIANGWECVTTGGVTPYSFTISDTTTSQAIDDGNTVTFVGNEGLVATVGVTDTVTYGIAASGVTTVKIANGAVTTTKLADGSVTNIKLATDAVNSGNIVNGSVTNADLVNNSLTVSAGDGLSGGGAVALGSSTILSLQPCASNEILKYDGDSWECAADNGGDGTGTDDQVLSILAGAANGQNTITYDLTIEDGNNVQFDDRDTLYSALAGGGLALNTQAFSLQTCAVGQVLKSNNGTTPGWQCAVDTDTTYTAGSGISFTGTQINNTGVLGVNSATTGGNLNSPILLGGTAQNPTVGFADGAVAGQFWQWSGTEWELSTTLAGDGDSAIGNEITGVTGSASGLTRSGSGTSVSPYTLAVNVGTGLAINGSNQITNTGVISFSVGASTALTSTGGQNPLVDLKPCADGEVLRYETTGSIWECIGLAGATAQTFDITDGSTTQTVGDNDTVTFIGNEGLQVTVGATDTVTYGIVDSGVTTVKLADGNVTNAKLQNSSITITPGIGLNPSGGGAVALGSSTTLGLKVCADGQILKYEAGSTNDYVCAADGEGTDNDTTYTVATGGGLELLSGNAFSLLTTCTNNQILKFNDTSDTWGCAADGEGTDNDTTYTAGTGLTLTGTAFDVNVAGADITTDGSDNLALTNSGASAGTYGNSGVNVAQLTVDAKGRVTSVSNRALPTATAAVTGVLSSTDFATFAAKENALTFSAPFSRVGNTVGLSLTSSGTSATTSSASGLEVAAAGLSVLRGCSNTQTIKWNSTAEAWQCANDIDTDTNTTYSAAGGLTLGGTTFSIDVTGATNGQVLTFNGSGVAWQSPAAPSCATGTGGTYFCQNGNSFGGIATLGTNDNFALAFETNGSTKMTILAGGNVGIGDTNPSAILHVSGTGTSLFKVTDSTATAADVLTIADEGAVTFQNRTNSTSSFRILTSAGAPVMRVDTSSGLIRLIADAVFAGVDASLDSGTGALQIGRDTSLNIAFDDNEIIARNNGGTATLFVQNNGGGFTVGATAVRFQNSTNSADSFQVLNADGTATILDIDTTTGSVGIGSTIHSAGLEVARPLDSLANNRLYNILSYDPSAAAQGVGGGIGFGGNADDKHAFAVIQGFHESATATNNAGGLRFFTRTNGNDILNEQMRITSTGNVGIGTQSPGQRLTVEGNISMSDTTSTAGILMQGSVRVLHSYGGLSNIFVGRNAGNLTQTGTYNVALGGQALLNVSSGSYNTALSTNGLLNTTTGSNNTSVGIQALLGNTTGNGNTGIGINAGYTGTGGAFANTTGSFNTFIGANAGPGSATQLNAATAIGAYSTVTLDNAVVLGCISGVNGCPSTSPVGIGNSAPSYLLHVGSATSMASGTSVARFQNADGTCTIHPTTAGGVVCTSDIRSKKNIESFTSAIALLDRINVKKYNMKADKDGTTKQIGVIAQEVEDVLPGLVMTDPDGKKSVSYSGLVPVLLAAIKEQQVQLNQLKQNTWKGGIVSKNTRFKSSVLFEGPVTYKGAATFRGDVNITGKIRLSGDQVNEAVLSAGQSRVRVSFAGRYASRPFVTATPREFLEGQHRVTDVDTTGFTIETDVPQTAEVRFDWHAFMKH